MSCSTGSIKRPFLIVAVPCVRTAAPDHHVALEDVDVEGVFLRRAVGPTQQEMRREADWFAANSQSASDAFIHNR